MAQPFSLIDLVSGRPKAALGNALALALLSLVTASARAADSWPQFRGPDGQGRTDEPTLPLTWSETEGVVWKTPIVGRGWSSPVVANGRIWLTTAEERVATDAEREKM